MDFQHLLKEDYPVPLIIELETKYTIKNHDGLMKWMEDQAAFLSEISYSNWLHHFQQLQAQLSNIYNSNRDDSFTEKDLIENIKNHFEGSMNQHRMIDFRSPTGKWLKKLKKDSPGLLNGAIGYLVNKRKQATQDTEGVFAAYLFEHKIKSNFDDFKQSWDDYYEEIKQLTEQHFEDLDKKKVIWEGEIQQSSEVRDSYAQKFRDQFKEHSDTMQEKEDFYEKKLAVKSAVKYWTDKASKHGWTSAIFGALALIMIIGLIMYIYQLGQGIIQLDEEDEIADRILTNEGALQIWVYGLFIASTTLIVWLIRLIVKIFLSNLHMYTDAEERATMIQTYLAFEREENTLKESDRDLILPAIFRSSQDGIVKDDSSPGSFVNLLLKKD